MTAQESAKAAAAFAAYCDMGPQNRSLRDLAHKTGTQLAQLGAWSSKYNWVERAKAWDEEQREAERLRVLAEAEEKRRRRDAAIEQMNERHAQIGLSLQLKLVKQVEALINAQKFGSQATVQGLKLGLDIERLARGEATERTEQQQSGHISVTLTPALAQRFVGETPDELAAWRKKRGLPPVTEERLG